MTPPGAATASPVHEPHRPMPPRRRRALILGALAAGTLLAALAAGVGLELWLRAQEHGQPMRWGWKDPYVAAGQRPAGETNELGYRGQPIAYGADDVVVLLVGDSQVQADACPFPQMPERRLGEHLGPLLGRAVKVFTAGALGYGTDQECLALEEYLARFRADAVVVWVTPGNDPREVLLPIAPVPKPTFWLEGDRLCGPTARIGDPVPQGLRAWQWLRDRVRGPLDVYWHEHVLPPTRIPLPLDDQPARTDWGIVSLVGDDFATEFIHVLAQLDPPSPRATYAMRLMNHLLHRMAERTRAQGGSFWVLLDERRDFPLPDGLYEAQVKGVRHRVRLSARAYAASLAAITEGLDVARVQVGVDPWAASPHDPHFNAQAVDEVMRGLANAIAAKLPRR